MDVVARVEGTHGVVAWLVAVAEIFEIMVVVVLLLLLVVIIRPVDAYSTDEKAEGPSTVEDERPVVLVITVAVLVGDLPWRVE